MALVNVGGKINLADSVANIDNKYGPYTSTQEAWDFLGPDNLDVLAIGLTVGIQATPTSPITEYWFKNACETVEDLIPKITGGSGAGTYSELPDKPSINNVELSGNKSLEDLGIVNYDDTEVRELINGKQETLISGTNIKTINNQSILGEGNIKIESSGDGDVKTDELIGQDSALEISDEQGNVALRVTTDGELETAGFSSKDNKIEVNPSGSAEEIASKLKIGNTIYELAGGSGGSDSDYAKWFKNTLAGKTFSIMGDSISTQPDYNAPEIKITQADIGVELNAWITPGDLDGDTKNRMPGTGKLTSLGGEALTTDDRNQKKTFTPIAEDVGKLVGQPHNYQPTGVKVWWQYLMTDLGMELYNAVTWTGSSISDHESKNRGRAQHQISYCWHESQIRKIGKRVEGSMERLAPDYVLIYRGTNDMTHTPYTVIEQDPFAEHAAYRYPTADEASDGTHVDFARALALTIKNIRDMYPTTKIVLCTFNNFIRISNPSTFPCNNGINSIAEYNKCIRNLADYFGCDVINFDKDNITWENCYSSGAVTDSASTPTHPNAKGHKIMGMRAIKDLLTTSSEFNSIL